MAGSFAEALLKSPITRVTKSQLVSAGVAFLRRAQCPAEAYSSSVIHEFSWILAIALDHKARTPERGKRVFNEVRVVRGSRN